MKKIVFGIIVLLACLTGCSKSDDNSYTFNSTGGVKEYAAEMNGTSLLITIGSTTSGESIHMIGHTDDTSSDGIDQWVASLDWFPAAKRKSRYPNHDSDFQVNTGLPVGECQCPARPLAATAQ